MYFKLILFNKNVLPFSQKNFKKSFPFAVTHKCWSHGTSKSSTAFLKKIKKKSFPFAVTHKCCSHGTSKSSTPFFYPLKKKKKKKKTNNVIFSHCVKSVHNASIPPLYFFPFNLLTFSQFQPVKFCYKLNFLIIRTIEKEN